jgi:hypothetical protein
MCPNVYTVVHRTVLSGWREKVGFMQSSVSCLIPYSLRFMNTDVCEFCPSFTSHKADHLV